MSRLDLVYLTDHRVLESLLMSESNQVIKYPYFTPNTPPPPPPPPAIHEQQQHQHQQHLNQNHIFQANFNQDDRRLLGEWMLDVCHAEHCQNDVFPLSMIILDMFLTKVEMKRRQLQLLGAVCLILACKVRQTHQISLKRMRGYTDNLVSIEQLVDWELLVLATLKWDLALVNPIDYLDILIRRPQCMVLIANAYDDSNNQNNITKKQSNLSKMVNISHNYNYSYYNHNSNINHQIEAEAQRLIYECSLDYSYSLYPPSMIACACLTRAIQSVLSSEVAKQQQQHQQKMTDNSTMFTFDANNNDQSISKQQQSAEQYYWHEPLLDVVLERCVTDTTTINNISSQKPHTFLTGVNTVISPS